MKSVDYCFKQILIYTRPWEVDFHLALGVELAKAFPSARLRYATFFSWARDKVSQAGLDAIYLPAELSKVTGNEIEDTRISELDRDLTSDSGANIALMLNSERFLPRNGAKAEAFGRKHLVVFDRLVGDRTLSVSSMYDHFAYWLGGALANLRHGAHFAFVPCGMPPNRVIGLRTPWETWKVAVSADEADMLLKQSREALSIPAAERIDYMRAPVSVKGTLGQRWARLKVKFEMHAAQCYDASHGSYFPIYEPGPLRYFAWDRPFGALFRALAPRREPKYDINEIQDLVKVGGQFCYLPLHLEPEATILMWSPWLRDQLELCRLVAQSLPFGWKLLVKENPKMVGVRELRFYRALKEIPSVLLINPKIESPEIIRRTECTVTLAGTASQEAVVLGKRGFYVGRPPFRDLCSELRFPSPEHIADHWRRPSESQQSDVTHAWRACVGGTFRASAVSREHHSRSMLDASDSNVRAYEHFILQAIAAAK